MDETAQIVQPQHLNTVGLKVRLRRRLHNNLFVLNIQISGGRGQKCVHCLGLLEIFFHCSRNVSGFVGIFIFTSRERYVWKRSFLRLDLKYSLLQPPHHHGSPVMIETCVHILNLVLNLVCVYTVLYVSK